MICRAAIIDDEPVAREIVRSYLEDIPGLSLVAECRDAFEATGLLAEQEIDLLFLDINLPRLSGISFARSVASPPLIIFTTAYPEYAVEGFELDAVDYLVKPFSFERFFKAVNKALERMQSRSSSPANTRQILLKADKKLYAIDPADILFAEGIGDYIRVVFPDRSLVVHTTLGGFTGDLAWLPLLRIHRSWAVNPRKIEYIEGNTATVSGRKLPVSREQKEELINWLGRQHDLLP